MPPAPPTAPSSLQAGLTARAHGAASAPNPGALEGLTLPAAAPPPPPGVIIAPPAPALAAPVAAAPALPPGPPVALGFAPGSALLPNADLAPLAQLAATRGAATLLVSGFGEGSMNLAVQRARRLADALTADGVPPLALRLTAAPQGSGGFAQLVY